MSNESLIKSTALKYFDRVGIAETMPSPGLALKRYEDWLDLGRHGDMEYLRRHLDRKRNPELLLPGAKSWIVCLLNYDTQEPLSIDLPLK